MADTEKYRIQGSSVPGQTLSRVILKGSVSNPEEWADVGSDVELTEEQVARLKASGVKLRKTGDTEASSSGASSDDSSDNPQQTPGGEVGSTDQSSGEEKPETTQQGGTSRSRSR